MGFETETEQYALPSDSCLQYAAKMAIVDDRPILMDYWTGSCDGTVIIGVRDSGEREGEKLLVKNSDEYTSPIVKIYKVSSEFIIMTENSLYVVKQNIETKLLKEN